MSATDLSKRHEEKYSIIDRLCHCSLYLSLSISLFYRVSLTFAPMRTFVIVGRTFFITEIATRQSLILSTIYNLPTINSPPSITAKRQDETILTVWLSFFFVFSAYLVGHVEACTRGTPVSRRFFREKLPEKIFRRVSEITDPNGVSRVQFLNPYANIFRSRFVSGRFVFFLLL